MEVRFNPVNRRVYDEQQIQEMADIAVNILAYSDYSPGGLLETCRGRHQNAAARETPQPPDPAGRACCLPRSGHARYAATAGTGRGTRNN